MKVHDDGADDGDGVEDPEGSGDEELRVDVSAFFREIEAEVTEASEEREAD